MPQKTDPVNSELKDDSARSTQQGRRNHLAKSWICVSLSLGEIAGEKFPLGSQFAFVPLPVREWRENVAG